MPDHPQQSSEDLLHESGCGKKVIAHCRAVRDCAIGYARHNPDADYSLIETASLLHDIGRGKTHSIHHAQEGADLLRSMDFSEEIARIVECHTGAGLTADECTLLGLSPRDCMPRTTEEKIVTHADNLIAGATRVTIYESIASAIHLPKKARKRMYRLAQDVELLCDGN
jgi:uncharacterized protein